MCPSCVAKICVWHFLEWGEPLPPYVLPVKGDGIVMGEHAQEVYRLLRPTLLLQIIPASNWMCLSRMAKVAYPLNLWPPARVHNMGDDCELYLKNTAIIPLSP